MNTPKYIDIHTHQENTSSDVISFMAKIVGEDELNFDKKGLYQLGIHPWHTANLEDKKQILIKNAQNPAVKFMGECGLDKTKNTNWEEQTEAFEFQVKLAIETHKPLVIHCVRAYQEILSILKRHSFKGIAIFHGYMGSSQLAEQIFKAGYYISIGAKILTHPKLQQNLKSINLDHVFFETDTADCSIEDVYQKVSEIKEIPMQSLINTTWTRMTNLHIKGF